jgi:hypothetical protein
MPGHRGDAEQKDQHRVRGQRELVRQPVDRDVDAAERHAEHAKEPEREDRRRTGEPRAH